MGTITMRARKGLLATPLLLLSLAACGGETKPAAEADASKPAVKVAQSEELGSILVDQSGRTLYAFTKDKDKASNCDADCIAVWPALTSTSTVDIGEGATASLLSETKQGDGATQATYGEWPLYYYVGDAVPGDVNGQAIDDEWFAVAPDGKLVKKST